MKSEVIAAPYDHVEMREGKVPRKSSTTIDEKLVFDEEVTNSQNIAND